LPVGEVAHTGVCTGVPFEVESVVKALAAQRTEITLDVAMTLHVSTQHSLLGERLTAHTAPVLAVCCLLAWKYHRKTLEITTFTFDFLQKHRNAVK